MLIVVIIDVPSVRFRCNHHGIRDADGWGHPPHQFRAAVIGGLLSGIATSPWMRAALRYGAIALAVLLFLLSLRRSGERAGRLAERLETMEKANDVQRRMLEVAARRPRDHHELAERLRDGSF
ncbi:hypothetical protein [Paracoccus alcaliphilus]|uniref:hypothetical protein n=1 Tax=Paracoccus alcaliphilus TaxID=34002 RepID=UPI001FCD6FF2|nr:hypothetical protein [Paracoccus alcaliphilus]